MCGGLQWHGPFHGTRGLTNSIEGEIGKIFTSHIVAWHQPYQHSRWTVFSSVDRGKIVRIASTNPAFGGRATCKNICGSMWGLGSSSSERGTSPCSQGMYGVRRTGIGRHPSTFHCLSQVPMYGGRCPACMGEVLGRVHCGKQKGKTWPSGPSQIRLGHLSGRVAPRPAR